MASVNRSFRVPFVLDASKLTRIDGILETQFKKAGLEVKRSFSVETSGGRIIEGSSRDEVLAMDNGPKSRITNLRIHAIGKIGEREPAGCMVEFEGGVQPRVRLAVEAEDTHWAMETFSQLDEQIERTRQTGIAARILTNRSPIASLFVVFFLGMAALTLVGQVANRSARFWESTEVTRISALADDEGIPTEKVVRELVKAQLRYAKEANEFSIVQKTNSWRFYALAGPLIIVIAALIYLRASCYPSYVFAWGDTEKSFGAVVSKRQTIWTTVIISIVLGVLTNLFVAALPGS